MVVAATSNGRSTAISFVHSFIRSFVHSFTRQESRQDIMILEVADFRIHAGQQQAFEEAIVRGVETVISTAKGFKGYSVKHSMETPERYLLQIQWETLENHTVDFRGSEAFTAWRAIVGPFFASAPVVEHFTSVA